MHRNSHRHKETNGRQVTEWQHLVTRHQHRNQNAQGDKDQAGGDHRGMAQQQRRIEADQELLGAELRLQTFTRLFRDWRQAIHNRFDHPRH